jgi:hypothetical protein
MKLTEHIVGGEKVSVHAYRLARNAARHLLAEPDLDLDSMTYHDYRAMRESEQGIKRPLSYNEFRSLLKTAEDSEPAPVKPDSDPTECDLIAYREQREQEG